MSKSDPKPGKPEKHLPSQHHDPTSPPDRDPTSTPYKGPAREILSDKKRKPKPDDR